VIGALTPDEVTALLFDRLATLERQNAEQRAALPARAEEVSRIFVLEADYDLTMREAEARWVRSLLAELTDGTLPGLAQWRELHATGTIPTDLADLGEGRVTPD